MKPVPREWIGPITYQARLLGQGFKGTEIPCRERARWGITPVPRAPEGRFGPGRPPCVSLSAPHARDAGTPGRAPDPDR